MERPQLHFSKFLLGTALLMASGTYAQEGLKTTRIDIFSNGTYFQQQEGNIPVNNGTARLYPVPEKPLWGAWWAFTPKGQQNLRVEVGLDTLRLQKDILSLIDVLKASVGAKVTLTLNSANEKGSSTETGFLSFFSASTGLLKLDKGNETLFLHSGQVRQVGLASGSKIADKVSRDTIVRVGVIKGKFGGNTLPIQVGSWEAGLRWEPSYLIKLKSKKEANLLVKATIYGAERNFADAEVNLVVGTPPMHFGQRLDPLSNFYVPQIDYSAQRNRMMMTRAAAAPMAAGGVYEKVSADMVSEEVYQPEGTQKEDMYFYKAGKLNLPAQKVVVSTLSQSDVPYEDVFVCGVGDQHPFQYHKSIYTGDNKFDVQHQIILQNKTKAPLQTGPVVILDEQESPLAHISLPYTPADGEAKINIASAKDIEVTYKESEIEKAVKEGKNLKANIGGTVNIKNLKKEKIKLLLSKSVLGEMYEADKGAKMVRTGKYNRTNANSTADWTIELAAGQTTTVSYKYRAWAYEN